MSMTFPDMQSLINRAEQRHFRQPYTNESESEYREAFADFMQHVDMVEAAEIRMGSMPLSFVAEADPLSALAAICGRSREDMFEMFKES